MTTTTPCAQTDPGNGGASRSIGWPVGFALAIPLLFVFYRYWLPDSVDSMQKLFGDWLPLSTINQCLIWVIMALGLNIVVGYAGLLDLGYVAFWAIGTYMAGWLMTTFVFDRSIKFHLGSPTLLNNAVGIHISYWLVLPIAGAFCALWGVIIGASDAAPAQRLPRDRHPRLRRDHPAVLHER